MRMKLVVIQLVLVALVPSSPAQLFNNYTGKPALYYDEFNDPVSFLSLGGHMELHCDIQGQSCDGNQFELQYEWSPGNRTKVASAPCISRWGKFRVNITEETKFGWYICIFNNNETGSFAITERMCGDQSSDCRNYIGPCTGTDQFCVVTDSQSSPIGIFIQCDNSAISICMVQGMFDYCNLITTSWTFSYCEAIRDGHFSTTFMQVLGLPDLCPGNENMTMKFAGVMRPLFEYIPIDTNQVGSTLAYHCPTDSFGYRKHVVCVIKRSSTDIFFRHDEPSCPDEVWVPLQAPLFASGSDIYKAKCEFDIFSNSSTIAILSQFLVVFGGNVIIHVGQVDNDRYMLECKLDPPASHKMDVSYTWTGRKTGMNTNGPILNITENDEFVCNVTIVYKSCSPHRLFSYSMVETINTSMPPPEIKPGGGTQTPGESQDWTWLYILLAVLALLVLIGIIVGLVLSKKRVAAAGAKSATAAKAASVKSQSTTSTTTPSTSIGKHTTVGTTTTEKGSKGADASIAADITVARSLSKPNGKGQTTIGNISKSGGSMKKK